MALNLPSLPSLSSIDVWGGPLNTYLTALATYLSSLPTSVAGRTGAITLTAADVAGIPPAITDAGPYQSGNYASGQAVTYGGGRFQATASFTTGASFFTDFMAGKWVALDKSRLKRVTMPISADGSVGQNAFYGDSQGGTRGSNPYYDDVNQRSAVLLPVTTGRWRLRVANTSPLTSTKAAGALTFQSVYVGAPSLAANGSWTGAFTAAPTQVLPAFTTPSDGSEYVSGWVTGAGQQFLADTLSAISVGWTNADGTKLTTGGAVNCWTFTGSGSSAATGTSAIPLTNAAQAINFIDIRLEFETVTPYPVVLCMGDSLTAGNIDDSSVFPKVPGQYCSWPGRAMLRNRMLTINAGVASVTAAAFASATAWAIARFDLATTIPDAAIIATGTNEGAAGTSTASYIAGIVNAKTMAQGLGITRFIAVTAVSPPYCQPATVTAYAPAGATTLQTSVSYNQYTILDIASETNSYEQVITQVTGGSSTGNGPFTTTLNQATTKAHQPGDTLANGLSKTLMDYNVALRQGSGGIGEIIDFAAAFPPDSRLYLLWGPNGMIHPGSGGYSRQGDLVRI